MVTPQGPISCLWFLVSYTPSLGPGSAVWEKGENEKSATEAVVALPSPPLGSLHVPTFFVLAVSPFFHCGAWCQICAEVVVHRMVAVFLNSLNGKNSSRTIVRDIFSFFFMLGFKISYSKYSIGLWVVIGVYCTSAWPVNKQVLAFTLFVRNSSRHVHDDCSIKKQSISTAFVKMNYKIMLKHGESVSECKHICHCDRFIFCILLLVHHNSMLLTLRKKFICLTVLRTVFVLFASQLTAVLPFSMRTSSLKLNRKETIYVIPTELV